MQHFLLKSEKEKSLSTEGNRHFSMPYWSGELFRPRMSKSRANLAEKLVHLNTAELPGNVDTNNSSSIHTGEFVLKAYIVVGL